MVTEKLPIPQNNKYTSFKNKEVEPVGPAKINIYQSNNYRKDLSWLVSMMSQGFKRGSK